MSAVESALDVLSRAATMVQGQFIYIYIFFFLNVLRKIALVLL